MDYKKFIKSRKLRVKFLSLLDWVPDRIMISLQYRIHTGRKLNYKNPKRFTEKLQLYKLRYRNLEMLRCTDKYAVRAFVKEKGLEDILIPLIGIFVSPDEIDFDLLPNQFVAKTTDGGGGNQIFICKDKTELNKTVFFKTLRDWMKQPKPNKSVGREWAYQNGLPRRILIEKLLTNPGHYDLPDYKFFCFDGKPAYCQVIGNRFTKETIDFFDMNWNRMPFFGLNPAFGPKAMPSDKSFTKPTNFEKLKVVAAKLAKDFPFSRIDLYDAEGKVWFGEVTFYPASGYGVFTPDKWDEKLGSYLNIDSFAGNKQS